MEIAFNDLAPAAERQSGKLCKTFSSFFHEISSHTYVRRMTIEVLDVHIARIDVTILNVDMLRTNLLKFSFILVTQEIGNV